MAKNKMKPMSEMRTGKIEPISHVMDREGDHDKEPMPHEVDAAIDTMARAEAHKANPRMMKAVKEAAGNKITSLKSLRSLAHKKSMG